MSDDAHASRIEALEMSIAHQDRMMADLNEVITAQWRKIEFLERQFARLREEVQAADGPRDGVEPPPPHY